MLTTQTPILVERQEEEKMFYKLDHATPCSLVGVGCAAHIVSHQQQTLLCDTENFVVKVFRYFHIYTIRTEELKEFCDFVEIEHATLLGTIRTSWLSLGPAVERVLKIYQHFSPTSDLRTKLPIPS